MLANGDSAGVDVPVSGVFYNSSSFDLVLRSAPLNASWSAQIPAFLPSTRTIVPLNAKVAEETAVDGEPAWKVQADFAGTAVTFWVGKDSRRLLRQVLQIRPNMAILFARPTVRAVPRRST